MICSFEKLIYPRSINDVGDNGYMVAAYHVHDRLPDAQGNLITQAKVVGYFLPTSPAIRFDMRGVWEKGKHGFQFKLKGFDEIIQHSREGIIAYLSAGLIKGIGPKTAEQIYAAFGDDTLHVLDNDPEQLLSIRGISSNKLKRICESYMTYRGARDIITLLASYGIPAGRALRIYKEFGKHSIETLRKHPYRLCGIRGIGFRTADAIACSLGLEKCSDERIDAGLVHTLSESESGGALFRNAGNLCIPKTTLTEKCLELLETAELVSSSIMLRINALLVKGELAEYEGMVYRCATELSERSVADRLRMLMRYEATECACDMDAELRHAERAAGVTLAAEQRHAVKSCLTSKVTIITGGPGTGKTMLQRIILDIFKRINPNAEILCCAPTGRAARRMHQSTGYPASTIHKALGLVADEDGCYGAPNTIDAELVLVDEVSMMDIHLARYLLYALPEGCRLILVGDADQLPSVGPGAVLSELIACERIPVITLDKVYRQSAGSRIAINAALIRHGTMALDYGDDFELLESPDFSTSSDILTRLYVREVQAHGVDNVVLLTPYRAKTETGVNALNPRLRELVNPPSPAKAECKHGKRIFRVNDKVMQVQNVGNISNGDIGYITEICTVDDTTTVRVDFGDGRLSEYTSGELDVLDLAYATTIHKSQGSEYHTVLLSLQTAHYIMLKRPLLYTAITRAKQKVVIVGERKALCVAIARMDAEKRGTMLASRIKNMIEEPLRMAL